MSTSIYHSRYWADWTSEALAGLDRSRLIAVLPIAAIEQHGPHLPLSVDADILQSLIEHTLPRLDAQAPVLFLPTQQVGKSNEHSQFAGTLTLSAQTLMSLWMELVDAVVASGVRKLLIFNSHGGQMNLMDVVLRDIRVKHQILAVSASWFNLGLPAGLVDDHELKHGIHGGFLETSVMLAAHPHKVRMDRAQRFGSLTERLEREYRYLSITPRGKIGWQAQDLNPLGACGDASSASAEVGRQVLEHVSARFAELLAEIDQAPLSLINPNPAWR
jgi:creatinine amidohydrolase